MPKIPRALVTLALLALAACSRRAEPRSLLEEAIAAHGGRERLASLDNVAISSRGRYKGEVLHRREIRYRAPDALAIRVSFDSGGGMAFGTQNGRCWRKERQFVTPCEGDDARETSRMAWVLAARFLHRLDPARVASAPNVLVDGRSSPSLRVGDLELSFDPQSHHLRRIRSGDLEETYSEERAVDGAIVAAQRVLKIDGELDVEETWAEIRPGGATEADVAAPPLSTDGTIVDEVDTERRVAWTDVPDLGPSLTEATRALAQLVRSRGAGVSETDGVLVTPLDDAVPPGRWRVALTLEPVGPFAPATEGALHLEAWPAERVIGIFGHGDFPLALGGREGLATTIAGHGARPRPGARHQIVCAGDCLNTPPADRLILLRIAVAPT